MEAPCGCVGGRGLHPFCFGVRLFNPPSLPPPPPDFFSYLGLVLSPSRLRTRMSRNSSLESQAFVMRTFTGNRLLLIEGSGVMIARSDSKEDAGKYSNGVGIGREGGGILSFFLLSAFLSSALHFATPFTMTLKMTTAHVVETSVTVNNNSPIQDYIHPDDQTQPTFEMTPGFKPFTHSTISERLKQTRVVNAILSSFNNNNLFIFG